MKIDYHLREEIDGKSYEVYIYSDDGEVFYVTERATPTVVYSTRQSFLLDYPDLESWFQND